MSYAGERGLRGPLADKDAEIERLQAEIAKLKAEGEKDYHGMREFQAKFIEADQERRALKELVARAADALLPYEWGFPDGTQIRELIAELRKAAQ